MKRLSAREFRQAASQLTEPVETRDGIFVPTRAPVFSAVRGLVLGELAVVGWDPGSPTQPGGTTVTGLVGGDTAKALQRGADMGIRPVPAQPLPAEARMGDIPFEIPATTFGDPEPKTITAVPGGRVRAVPKPSQRKPR